MSDKENSDAAAYARRQAEEVFSGHVVVRETSGQWLCRNPSSNIYAFRVTLAGRAIVVTGDIGDVIFYHQDRQPLPWLRRALASPGYLLSKAPPDVRVYEFDPDAIGGLLDDVEEGLGDVEDDDRRKLMRDDIDFFRHGNWDSEDLFLDAWCESTLFDGDYPDLRRPTPTALWIIEALRWFVQRRPEETVCG